MISKDELVRMREYCEKAAPGPWRIYERGIYGHLLGPGGEFIAGGEASEGYMGDDVNTRFMVGARTDLPRLIDDYEKLLELAKRLAGTMTWHVADRDIESDARKAGLIP